MAIALDQDLGFSGTTNNTITVSGTFPSGALILVCVGFGTSGSGGSSLSQSGNSFTTLFTRVNAATNNLVYYYGYIKNWGGGSLSTTFTLNSAGKDAGARLLSFTGADTSAPLLLSHDRGSNPKSTTMDSTAATGTTNSTDLIVGFFTWANTNDITGDSAGGTPSTGWTETAHSNGGSGNTPHGHALFTYQILTSAVSNPDAQVTFTSPSAGVSFGATVATFLAAAGSTVNGSATLVSDSSLVVQGDGESVVLASQSVLFPYTLTSETTILALGSDSAVLQSDSYLVALGSDNATLNGASNLSVLGGASATLSGSSSLLALGSDSAVLATQSIIEALAGAGVILASQSSLFPDTLTGSTNLIALGTGISVLSSSSSVQALGSDSATISSESIVQALGSGSVVLQSDSFLFSPTLTAESIILVLGSDSAVLGSSSALSVTASSSSTLSATLLSASSLLSLGSNELSMKGAATVLVLGSAEVSLTSGSSSGVLGSNSASLLGDSIISITPTLINPFTDALKVFLTLSTDLIHALFIKGSLIITPKNQEAINIKPIHNDAFKPRFLSTQPLVATFTRRPNVANPNSTHLTTMLAQNKSGVNITNLATCTVVVTFPDQSTSNFSLAGATVINNGDGTYTITYTTKGVGNITEAWTFTDSLGNTANYQNIVPTSY